MSTEAIYLSSDDEKSTTRQSIPKLKGSEDFIFLDLAIRTYLGTKCTTSIERPRPTLDANKLRQLQRDLGTSIKRDRDHSHPPTGNLEPDVRQTRGETVSLD